MQLLQDVFIVENLQVLTEGKTNSTMKIRGVFGRCNEKNNNGRIYPTTVLESQLSKVQPLISERRLCGELDHPSNDTVKLSNASHLITKLEMKGNELIGEAEVLKTPAGLTAQALINGGVKIGISSRGMGTLSEDQNGDKVVNEDFRLVTFDLVADPSTRGAFPGLSESTQGKFATEKHSKLKKESNFITMLESRMRDAYQPYIAEAGPGEGTRKSERTKAAEERAKARAAKAAAEAEKAEADENNKKSALELSHSELTKAYGHWHRIAEALAEAMGYDVSEGAKAGYPEMGIAGGTPEAEEEAEKRKKEAEECKKEAKERKKKVNEQTKPESETKDEPAGAASLLQKRMRPDQSPARPEGTFSRMARHSSERRHARRLAIAQAKGARAGAKQLAKGDVEADRIRARGAAGGSVSMNPLSPGRQSYGQATRALQQRRERSQRKIDRVPGPSTPASDPAPAKAPDPAPTTPKRGEGRSEALQADRDKLAAELRARRAGGGNVGSVKGARTQGKGRLQKAHGTTEAFAYQDLGDILAEMMHLREDEDWIQDAEKSIKRRGTEGKCTPITKKGCTGRAKALAKTFKKMAKKRAKKKQHLHF